MRFIFLYEITWIGWINGSGLKWELMQSAALCCEKMSSDVMQKGDQR